MLESLQIDLHELNLITIIFRVLLAVLIGGIVGLERNIKNHTAGFRTHILVCLGSAIVMMTNQYVVEIYPASLADPTRMGAQVISGIGFLGAGTILITQRNRVKGLTTAAGLWAAATIGLAVGIGFYSGAIVGGGAVLAIMTILRPVKRFFQAKSKMIDAYVIADSMATFKNFLIYCSDYRVNILNLNIETDFEGEVDNIVYFISLDLNNRVGRVKFLEGIEEMEGIEFVEELELT